VETLKTLRYWRRLSSTTASKQSRQCLTELRVICTTVAQWGKLTYHPCGLIPVCQNQLQNVETIVLKWMLMTDGW